MQSRVKSDLSAAEYKLECEQLNEKLIYLHLKRADTILKSLSSPHSAYYHPS